MRRSLQLTSVDNGTAGRQGSRDRVLSHRAVRQQSRSTNLIRAGVDTGVGTNTGVRAMLGVGSHTVCHPFTLGLLLVGLAMGQHHRADGSSDEQGRSGLKDEDIEAMVKDAEANADADKQRRELVEARNNAEALVHNTEKQLEEHGDKVEEDVKTEIETAVADLKEVTESDDAAEIQAKHQALMTAAMKLGEAIYNSQQSEQAEGDAAATAAADGDDVVDADFEEVDEDRPNS